MRHRKTSRWRAGWPVAAVLATPLMPLLGALLGDVYTYLTPLYMFVVIPLLDMASGTFRLNPLPDRAAALERDRRWTHYLYIGVAINAAVFLVGAAYVSFGAPSLLEAIGMIVSVGIITGGLGITIAHELFHRPQPLAKFLGHLNLVLVGYAHYAIEHISGHHVYVATPRDPVTGRRGESLYAFLARVVVDEARSAWRIEGERLRRRKRPVLSLSNRILRLVAIEIAFVIALAGLFGPLGVLFWAAQSLVAICLLETVNYVEHYGLLRREVSPGRYEPVDARHSWDADQRLSNLLLFNLQRHADHHSHPSTPYQALQHLHASPKLPTGYPGMIVVAAIPPLYRRVMHPRLDAFRQGPYQTPAQVGDEPRIGASGRD